MKPTSSAAFRAVPAAWSIHGPLTKEESAQFLKTLNASFRKSLEALHPSGSVRERSGKEPSTSTEQVKPRPIRSAATATESHLMSILQHPLLAVSPHRSQGSPVDKLVGQAPQQIPRQSLLEEFQRRVAAGTATTQFVVQSAKAEWAPKPSGAHREDWAETFVGWLKSCEDPDIPLSNEELRRLATRILISTKQYVSLPLQWLQKPLPAEYQSPAYKRAAMIKQDILKQYVNAVSEKDINRGWDAFIRGVRTIQLISPEIEPRTLKIIVSKAAGNLLNASNAWEDTSKIDPEAFERFLRTLDFLGLKLSHFRALLLHPTRPDLDQAKKFLHSSFVDHLRTSTVPHEIARRNWIIFACIIFAQRLCARDQYADAFAWMKIVNSVFENHLSMIEQSKSPGWDFKKWLGAQLADMRELGRLDMLPVVDA